MTMCQARNGIQTNKKEQSITIIYEGMKATPSSKKGTFEIQIGERTGCDK